MKNSYSNRIFSALLPLFFVLSLQAQDNRVLIRGQVLYRNVNVPNENVINLATEHATITDEDGRFAIEVKAGDEVAFTAVNYQIMVLKITGEMIKSNRLVVEVNEKVTELDEVVVTPENQERFLKVKNEEFKGREYEIDRSTEVENIALSRSERGMKDGINFVNIFKALVKSGKKEGTDKVPLKLSEVLRLVYDDQFFVSDLKIPQDWIGNFLVYLDEQAPEQSLLKKDNEFQLIDYLVNQSRAFLKEMHAER